LGNDIEIGHRQQVSRFEQLRDLLGHFHAAPKLGLYFHSWICLLKPDVYDFEGHRQRTGAVLDDRNICRGRRGGMRGSGPDNKHSRQGKERDSIH
jgi:hypothetical protein